MTVARPRWRARDDRPAPDVVRRLEQSLRLPEPLCRLLAARGHATPEQAKSFLRPSLAAQHDPWRLPDIDGAVARLETAIDAGETIFVHGDYDVDGMCATALYAGILGRLGAGMGDFRYVVIQQPDGRMLRRVMKSIKDRKRKEPA